MENLNIENAKTRFFESKEQYLNFKQAWKDFHNSDKLVWREDVEVYSYNLDRNVTMRNVKHTSLSAQHYMLYNLLREYGIQRGFTPPNDAKDHQKWDTCYYTASEIYRTSKRLADINSTSKSSREYARKDIDALLLPFGGHVSHEALRGVGEWVSIMIHNNQNYPQFEVEEYKDFTEKEEAQNKLSIAERIQSWRTA
jgi:hypothetical protein